MNTLFRAIRDRLPLLVIAGVFIAGWFAVGATRDVPVIDDWVYAWSVEHLLAARRLAVLEFSSIYPVAQIVWGALFARAFGFSFVVAIAGAMLAGTLVPARRRILWMVIVPLRSACPSSSSRRHRPRGT